MFSFADFTQTPQGFFSVYLWIILALIAALGYTLVEFIDEGVLEGLKGSKNEDECDESFKEWNEDEGVGTLTLISGFFGIAIAFVLGISVVLLGNVVVLQVGWIVALKAIAIGCLEVVWMIPYLKALNRGGAINVGPLFQIIPVMSFFFGWMLLGETQNMQYVLGCAIIVIGAILLNLKKGTFKPEMRVIGLMVVATSIISASYVVFKEVALEGNFVAAFFYSGIGMALMSGLIWISYAPYRNQLNDFMRFPDRKLVVWQFINEAVNTLSVIASHLANIAAPSVMVATAVSGAAHPIFTLLMGWLLANRGSEKHVATLGEGEIYKKIMAMTMIVSGTIAVTWQP